MDLLNIRKKAREQKEAEKAREKEPAREPAPAMSGAAPEQGQPEAGDRAAEAPAAPPAETREEQAPTAPPSEGPAADADRRPEERAAGEAEAEAQTSANVEYLAFMLSDEEYGVKVEDVKEIIRWQKITSVPRAPDFVMGVISLRGVILPVFDLKKRLGLGEVGRSRSSRVLVVSDRGSLHGIAVDKVAGVVKLGQEVIEPPPSVIGGVEAGYLEGVGRLGDRLVILFDTPRVLSMEG